MLLFFLQIYSNFSPKNPARRALFIGPVLIAGDFGQESLDPANNIPEFITSATDPNSWLKREVALQFWSLDNTYPSEVVMRPFYEMVNEHYTVYWDYFTPDEWTVQRATRPGGYLSFVMQVDPEKDNVLTMTYWGKDNRNSMFYILADDEVVATDDINKYKENRFYEIDYNIPRGITSGKTHITVLLKEARPNNNIGPFYLAIITRK